MKIILSLIFVMLMFSCGKSIVSVAQAHENTEPANCTNHAVLKPIQGTFYKYCPKGSVVTATNSTASGRFVYTYVLCARVTLVCTPDDVDIDPDTMQCGFVGCNNQEIDETI